MTRDEQIIAAANDYRAATSKRDAIIAAVKDRVFCCRQSDAYAAAVEQVVGAQLAHATALGALLNAAHTPDAPPDPLAILREQVRLQSAVLAAADAMDAATTSVALDAAREAYEAACMALAAWEKAHPAASK